MTELVLRGENASIPPGDTRRSHRVDLTVLVLLLMSSEGEPAQDHGPQGAFRDHSVLSDRASIQSSAGIPPRIGTDQRQQLFTCSHPIRIFSSVCARLEPEYSPGASAAHAGSAEMDKQSALFINKKIIEALSAERGSECNTRC